MGIIILVIVLVLYGIVSRADYKNIPEMTNIQKRELLANECLLVGKGTKREKGDLQVVYLFSELAGEVEELMKRQSNTRGIALVLPAKDFATWQTEAESRPNYMSAIYFYVDGAKISDIKDARKLDTDTFEFQVPLPRSATSKSSSSCWVNSGDGWKKLSELNLRAKFAVLARDSVK